MKAIGTIIERFTPEEREKFRLTYEAKTDSTLPLQTRYLQELFKNPDLSGSDFISSQKITRNTFNKIRSLAYDELIAWIGQHIVMNFHWQTHTVWWFVTKGLYQEAWSLFRETEKKLLERKHYPGLEALYSEGIRVLLYLPPSREVLERMEDLRDASILNASRLMEFTTLSKTFNVENLRLQNAGLKQTIGNAKEYEKRLRRLYHDAVQTGQTRLMRSAAYCLIVWYTRHETHLKKLQYILDDYEREMTDRFETLIPEEQVDYWQFFSSLYSLYDLGASPMPYYAHIEAVMPRFPHTRDVIYFAKAGYAISVRRYDIAFEEREKLRHTVAAEEKTKLMIARIDVSLGWYLLRRGELSNREFIERMDAVFHHPERKRFPEVEFMTRVSEILFLCNEGEWETALMKCDALRKFAERSASPLIPEFSIIIPPYTATIRSRITGKPYRRRSGINHSIRWTRWAMEELDAVMA